MSNFVSVNQETHSAFSSTILIYINYTFAAKITRFCIITQYHRDFKPDYIKKYMSEEKKLKYLSFLKNKPNKKISKNKIFLNFLGSVIVCGYFVYCDFALLTQEKKAVLYRYVCAAIYHSTVTDSLSVISRG